MPAAMMASAQTAPATPAPENDDPHQYQDHRDNLHRNFEHVQKQDPIHPPENGQPVTREQVGGNTSERDDVKPKWAA